MRPSYIPFTRTLSASFLAVFRRFTGGFPAAFLVNATSSLFSSVPREAICSLALSGAFWRFLALSGSFLAAFRRFAGGFPVAFLVNATSFLASANREHY